jgi:hypothetical protein
MEIIVVIDGAERPGWALRAGQQIVATKYLHDDDERKRKLTVWVEGSDDPPWRLSCRDYQVA